MKNLILLATLSLFISCNNSEEKKTEGSTSSEISEENNGTTVYYLIRHAEKDRSNPNEPNPELTEAGHERAKKWADYFSDKKLDKIYTTPYKRTMQTVLYTADRIGITPLNYDPSNLYTKDFQEETKGENVLIAGHSNTTPAFVNAILGKEKYPQMDDNDNASLYIVTINNGSKDVQIIKIGN